MAVVVVVVVVVIVIVIVIDATNAESGRVDSQAGSMTAESGPSCRSAVESSSALLRQRQRSKTVSESLHWCTRLLESAKCLQMSQVCLHRCRCRCRCRNRLSDHDDDNDNDDRCQACQRGRSRLVGLRRSLAREIAPANALWGTGTGSGAAKEKNG